MSQSALHFVLTQTLSRPGATWRKDWFCLDCGSWRLASVSETEDAIIYHTPAHSQLGLPWGVVPCLAADYEAALGRYRHYEQQRAAREQADKQARKLLRGGMSRHEHASREAGATQQAAQAAAPTGAELLADFTVLDLEFQPQPSALLELAAIRYQNWQPVGKLVSFVQCRQELNPHVAKLTGITRADVFNAPPEKEVLQAFFKLAEGSVLVAHNIGADRTQLEAARTRCGATKPLANPWLCTLALAKQRRSPGAACGLGDLCLDFGINAVGAHRALRDVEMCYQVLRHFQQQQPLTELITSSAKPKAGQGQLFAPAT